METPETLVLCTECVEPIIVSSNIFKKLRKIFCPNCWTAHCVFRFRKRILELGKPNKGSSVNLLLAPSETVLIYYDGSPSSVALINLIRESIIASAELRDNLSQKNLPFPFNFSIIVILESDDIGGSGSIGRQKKHIAALLNWLKLIVVQHNIDIPLYVSSIEHCFSKPIELKNGGIKQILRDVSLQNVQSDETLNLFEEKILLDSLSVPFDSRLNSQLSSVLANIKTKTSQKDFISILQHNLIASAAQSLKLRKVILPEDQSYLAIKMFTIMSLGRGAQLAEQMGFTTVIPSGEGGVTCARPLMDFVSDDLRQYLRCLPQEFSQGIFSPSSPTKGRKMKIDSLERQCDNFIVELQSGFPSTVPTLAKIGEKLCPSGSGNVGRNSGRMVESTGRRQCKLCKRLEEESDQDDLCYGCSNISKDMKEPELLRILIAEEDCTC